MITKTKTKLTVWPNLVLGLLELELMIRPPPPVLDLVPYQSTCTLISAELIVHSVDLGNQFHSFWQCDTYPHKQWIPSKVSDKSEQCKKPGNIRLLRRILVIIYCYLMVWPAKLIQN